MARAIRRHRSASALSSTDVNIYTPPFVASAPSAPKSYRAKERAVCSKRLTRRAAKLPKAEHDADEWQVTMEALLLVAAPLDSNVPMVSP